MGIKQFPLFFCIWTCILLMQPTWATNTILTKNSDCSPIENGLITLLNIESLSAEECFEYGKCEYSHQNFSNAYTFFLSAQLKGHSSTASFNKYFAATKAALDSLQKTNSPQLNLPATKIGPSNQIGTEKLTTKSTVAHDNYLHSLQNYLVNYISLLVAIGGIFIAIRLLIRFRKEDTHNIFLAIFLIGISIMILELAIYWLNHFNYHPRVYFFKMHFFLWAPSLYLYIRKKLSIGTKTTISELLKHYGTFFVFCLLLLIAVNTDGNGSSSDFNQIITQILHSQFIKSIHSTLYLLLLIALYRKHKSILDPTNKKWLFLAIAFLGLLMLILYSRAIFSHIESFDYISKSFTAMILSLFVCLCGIMFFIKPEIITETEVLIPAEDNVKYRNSGLTEAMTSTLKSQLVELVESKKVYLDNGITLEKLAKELNTDRYSLSQVINQEFEKNFYEFINDYRVAEAVNIIEKNQGKIKLVADLIYESGFNNKVSFYKAFKRRKHMTPTQYIKAKYKQPKPR